MRSLPLRGTRAALWVWLSTYRWTLVHSVPPGEYIEFGLQDPGRRTLLNEYLFETDTPAILMLNRLRGAENEDVQDKARFAEICAEHGLPHAETLACFRRGAQTQSALPAHTDELWVKPTSLGRGEGAEHWVRAGDRYRAHDGRVLSARTLLRNLQERDCLVQARIGNHPQIEDMTNGRLASIRIVTGLRRGSGGVELVANLLHLPEIDSLISSGGIVAALDWEDGSIIAVLEDHGQTLTRRGSGVAHPLLGRVMPHWHSALALVQHAHRVAFSRFATLGWDVAITPDGPVLLEANSGWGTWNPQMLSGPFGLTALTIIIEEELAAQHPRKAA